MLLLSFIITYIIGFLLSLIIMHKYKRGLDIDCYDPPHDDYYDDYDSNASAYVAFSIMWPLYWFINGIAAGYNLLIKMSESFGKYL